MGEMSTDTHDNDRRLHSEHNGLFIGGWYHGIPLMFAPLPYDDDLNHDKISGEVDEVLPGLGVYVKPLDAPTLWDDLEGFIEGLEDDKGDHSAGISYLQEFVE